MKLSVFSILVCFLLALASCKSRKPVQPVVLQNTKEVTKIVRDTVFKVAADSSYYQAYVDCRDGKPVIIKDSVVYRPGKNTGTNVSLKGNNLNVDCKAKAQELFKSWQETYIKEHEQKPIYVPQNVYRDKPVTKWQNIQLWFGRIFIGFLAISCLIGILRWRGIL